MNKLLSFVLSISILVSSITPALGQALGRLPKGITKFPTAASTHLSANLSRQIAAKTFRLPSTLRGVKFYQNQLKNVHTSLRVPQTNLSSFLTTARKAPAAPPIVAVRNAFANASLVGLMGTPTQAFTLLDFYKQAQGTMFEDAAALTTARGLLRMQAYEQLGEFLAQNANKPVLSGVAAYALERKLPLEIPAELQSAEQVAADDSLAAFLGEEFLPNRLQADPSLKATQLWMDIVLPQEVSASVQTPAAAPAAQDVHFVPPMPGGFVQPVTSFKTEALSAEQTPAANTSAAQDVQFVPPMPGGFVQPVTSFKTEAPLSKQTPAANAVSLQSGIAYSGVPVFAATSFAKRVSAWVRGFLKKGKKYDRASFPVNVQSASGEVQPTPLTFSIGESVASADYDRIVFREDPRFAKGYIVELHDHGKDPIQMDHFYMALYNQDVGRLVKAAAQAGVSLRLKLEHAADVSYETISKPVYSERTGEVLPLEVSVQLNRPLWSRELKQAFSHWLEALGLPGTYSPSMLANAKLVLRDNGEIWAQPQGAEKLVPLPKKYYVRLPKNQIGNIVKMLPQLQGEPLNVVLSPTANRVNIVARDASLTNVSLGKTMGSVVKHNLGVTEAFGKALMMFVYYVLPGFASLLTPVLKKYGEKNLLTVSLGMSAASGVLATLGGFYGFVEQMTLGPVQKALFVSAMLLMSGSAILKQLVSNMLIRANRGEVVLSTPDKKVTAQVAQQAKPQTEGLALISKRFKEFFTKKSEVSLRDIALYNLGFVYKNVGTLAFLSAPFIVEHGVKALTGVDLGIDYSASFPLYTAYSSYVLWKILRSKLRDAYTAKTLIQSQQMVTNMLKSGGKILAGEVNQTVIDDVARSFKDSLDALAFAHIKLDSSKSRKALYSNTKEEILAQLQKDLVEQHQLSAPRAQELVEKVAASMKVQENNLGNMWKMIKAPGVLSLTSAMTLATVHEFVISSSFAGTMKSLISQGELANFLMAASLYVPFIVGRLGGNWVSRRISKDSMYLLCSTLSAVGTGIMATAGNSVEQAIAGAAIASLGVGNFFTQMYDYIMTKYPKQNRELSSILALTMGLGGLGAIPAGYFATQAGMGMPLDLLYAGGVLAASLILTPGMFMNSSLIKGLKGAIQKPWQNLKTRVKNFFNRDGGDEPPFSSLNLAW